MHSGHRLYSDFFWSGLQGMADPSSALPPPHLVSPQTPVRSRRRRSFLGIPNLLALSASSSRSTKEDVLPQVKRQRRISSLLPGSTKENDKEYTRPHVKTHRRISSLLPNSPKKWFDRISRPASALHESYHPAGRHSVGNDEAAGDKVDLWITAGGPFLLTNCADISDIRTSEFFPESKSQSDDATDGVNEDENTRSPPARPKHGLFLSASPSPQESLRRRDRSSSVQTMSIIPAAHSRRSSLQQWSISKSDKSEKRDSFNFCVWRELSPLENEDTVHLDWREFHANLLHNTDVECDL